MFGLVDFYRRVKLRVEMLISSIIFQIELLLSLIALFCRAGIKYSTFHVDFSMFNIV